MAEKFNMFWIKQLEILASLINQLKSRTTFIARYFGYSLHVRHLIERKVLIYTVRKFCYHSTLTYIERRVHWNQ